MRYVYSKKDRLTNSKDIEKLFHQGKAFFSFPLRLICLEHMLEGQRIKSAALAPKKKLPKAHERNRVKRLLKEVIRHELPLIRQEIEHPLNNSDFLLVFLDRNPHVKIETLKKAFQNIILEMRNAQNTQ